MSTKDNAAIIAAIADLKEVLLALTPEADAPAVTTTVVEPTNCGVTTKAGTACRNEAGKCRHHEATPVAAKKATKKAATKKATKKAKATTKVVKVEVTGGNRVTRTSCNQLRELGATALGKRSLEVVTRRAAEAGIELEPVAVGSL